MLNSPGNICLSSRFGALFRDCVCFHLVHGTLRSAGNIVGVEVDIIVSVRRATDAG